MKLVGELTQQQLKSVIKYIPVCGLFLYTRNWKNRNVDGMTRAYGVRRGPLD